MTWAEKMRAEIERKEAIDRNILKHTASIQSLNERVHNLEMEHSDSDGYKFITSDIRLVCLAEIAEDVKRNNPVVEVVVEGARYKELHCLLLHTAIYAKMELIAKAKGAELEALLKTDRYDASHAHCVGLMVKKLKVVTETVKAYHVNSTTVPFRTVLEALGWVYALPLTGVSAGAAKVIVRYK